MAGMSLQELSDTLINQVTKQALNKYELGQMKPTTDVLLELSKALKVSPDYFLKVSQVEFGEISFRKRNSLLKKDEDAIIERVRDHIERYLELENILAVSNTFQNPFESDLLAGKPEVEIAANKLRSIWELGNGPIANVIETLELKGVKIVLIDAVDDIDGFAVFTSSKIPVVVVNTKDRSIERIRFTVIHELAHILLRYTNESGKPHKEIEALCHYFSSCFLIPSKMLLSMIGGPKRSYISIKELIAIKEYYGVSIRAIVHRLKELEVITPNYYQRWVIYMSKEYGNKIEPGGYSGEEKSRLFDQLINRALSEEVISMSKAATLANISVSELRKRFLSDT